MGVLGLCVIYLVSALIVLGAGFAAPAARATDFELVAGSESPGPVRQTVDDLKLPTGKNVVFGPISDCGDIIDRIIHPDTELIDFHLLKRKLLVVESVRGPQLNIKINRFHVNNGYTSAVVRGSSPFFFDQNLQGATSASFTGDVKIAKWLRIGGGYGYNIVEKADYAQTLAAAFGPDDLKLLINRDLLNKTNRFGFDILYGQPVPFSKGNFPTRGVGWRMGKPVAELPCSANFIPGALNGELPWVY